MTDPHIKDIWQLLGRLEKEEEKSYSESLELAAKLTAFCEENPDKPIYGKNVLDFLKPKEPQTSWIIREILAFRDKGRYPILQDFLNRFFGRKYKVDKPIITAEVERIDVLVRDSDYVLIMENKLKGAGYQPNQLARYISLMQREQHGKDILLVLIPEKMTDAYINHIPRHVWRLPKKNNKCDLKCKSVCECKSFEEYRPQTKILTKDFSEWLSSVVVKLAMREKRLIATMTLFVDYLNKIYKIDINEKYNMDVKEFLREQLDLNGQDFDSRTAGLRKIQTKLAEVNELRQHLLQLFDSEDRKCIEECQQKMLEYSKGIPEFADLQTIIQHPNSDQGWETGLIVDYKGISMFVHINSCNDKNSNAPRWGIWVDDISDTAIELINKEILCPLGSFELLRNGDSKAQMFVTSDFSSVFNRWKHLMDAILEAKRRIE